MIPPNLTFVCAIDVRIVQEFFFVVVVRLSAIATTAF